MSIFKMPSLGADMDDGVLVEWDVKPGDRVSRGDIVAVVETQKGAIEIEIFESGTITRLLAAPGDTIAVGAPLAELDGPAATAGETEAAKAAPAPSAKAAAEPAAETLPERPAAPTIETPAVAATAREKTAPAVEAAPAAKAAPAGRVRASPAARQLAAERGIDLAGIQGTGPDGAVVRDDVAGGKAPQPAPGARPAAPTKTAETTGPARRGFDVDEMRKAIAAAMSRSKREIPHYYLSHTIDMRVASGWLDELNAQRPPEERVLIGMLLLKASALALTRFPEFNGRYENEAFAPAPAVHIGMAVAMRGGGLVAPALHDVDRLSLEELMAKARDLVARVRSGRLRSSEFTDAGITVTSLGERGVDTVFGVIYPPQVAIVGFGTVAMRALATENGVDAVPTVCATLAADHRVSDGRRGALFLREIDKLLQVPEAL
ncbi:MAG: dihydrolipoamide acetyltransferase family protein [Parvibaculum sp.]|uniref:dihydrolipoamide acetyltransferase family protein n=1 Tax=Parvibaculum sp. TaxID=2024848 RepID=UPI00271B5EB3|nr:dihydrolipoamide acetyltransferase family protein [Parvibaculum sp.]MDO8840441.1 dihydrolipoamide acetyltransferase family protein [Parvibaculum sp.]